jgi:triacylglycerol lipase
MLFRQLSAFILIWIISFSASAGERLPIVFAHGIWINPEVYEYLLPLKKTFQKYGYDVHIARTPIGGTLEQRSQVLESEIYRLVPHGRYHLIGHSMGGLDARLAIDTYNLGERCASLTTLATPHYGSVIADYVISNLDKTKAMEILEKLFAHDVQAVRQLTTTHMTQEFNSKVLDDKRVKYFSMGFFIPQPAYRYSVIPWLWFAHDIQSKAGFPLNDGMVSTQSSLWGESLGDYPGDHYTETAPFPLGGDIMYDDVVKRVAENLDLNF